MDVDYCMQTVAWFFKPFWDLAKVEDYTRKVVQDEKRYFARALSDEEVARLHKATARS